MTHSSFAVSDTALMRDVHGQNGSVFIIALILLSILTLLGVTATKNTSIEEGMVSNTRDRQLAFQAAEAALQAGERYVQSTHPVFDDSCTNGFCTQSCPTTPRCTDTSLNVWNNAARHQNYSVKLSGVLTNPKFIIEDLCEYGSKAWRDANPGWTNLPQRMYRITAQGTGGTDNARVMLQSTYAVTRVVNPACTICDPSTLSGVMTTAPNICIVQHIDQHFDQYGGIHFGTGQHNQHFGL